MRNKLGDVLWGLVFIILGIGFAGNAFHIWNFRVFFDGWWTLFIIVPCAISMIQNGTNTGNTIGLVIGLLLLLSAQDVLYGVEVSDLIIPVILIIIGFSFLFRNRGMSGVKKNGQTIYPNGKIAKDITAIFGGRKVRYDNEEFPGATLTAVFGGVDLDIQNAIITEDVVINATSIFGGVDIHVPGDVQVKINSVPILGSVSKRIPEPQGPIRAVIYVNATSVFGGVDIK